MVVVGIVSCGSIVIIKNPHGSGSLREFCLPSGSG